MQLLIKLCGVTTPEDALACAEAGADALGLNFWPGSPRCVGPGMARRIADVLAGAWPRLLRVGVFVNAAEAAREALAGGLIHVAQLHGDEPPEAADGLPGPAWKGLRLGDPTDLALLRRFPPARYPLVVIDAPSAAYGGSGRRMDLALAAQAAAERPVLLAGGLGPESVFEAILAVRPAGVDVASGVEERPGRKHLAKVRDFIAAARAAAAQLSDPRQGGTP